METFSVEDWELARSNIITWASDLSSAPPTKELRAIRQRIYDLGKRIDDLTLPPVQDEEPTTPEKEDVQDETEQVADEADDAEEEEEEEPEFIENESTVLVFLFNSWVSTLTFPSAIAALKTASPAFVASTNNSERGALYVQQQGESVLSSRTPNKPSRRLQKEIHLFLAISRQSRIVLLLRRKTRSPASLVP
jgi:hypothetical protein